MHVIHLFHLVHGSVGSYAANAEGRLYERLLQGYNRVARPVRNSNESVDVKFSLTVNRYEDIVSCCLPMSILDVDPARSHSFTSPRCCRTTSTETFMCPATCTW